jgi:nicotinamide-nucleotide amidase
MHNPIELATRVGEELKSRRLLLSVAESCTGGGICHAITEIPGSSEWFDCGFITYSNSSKTEILDIPAALLAQHGAVSEEIAAAMAESAVSALKPMSAFPPPGLPDRPARYRASRWERFVLAGVLAASPIPNVKCFPATARQSATNRELRFTEITDVRAGTLKRIAWQKPAHKVCAPEQTLC